MHYPRWYPDLTELSDGRFVAISGNTTDAGNWADTPEVYDPTANKWTALTGVSTSRVHEEEYPFSYLVPNGNVFTIGPAEDQSFQLNVRRQDVDAGGRLQRRRQRLVGDVPARPGPLQRRRGEPQLEHAGEGERGGHRPELGDPDMAADGADGTRPDLPHADDARRRHRAGRGRRADRRPDRQVRGLGRRAAERDLEPELEELVARGRHRRHARLSLDRGADARRDRARGRQRRTPVPDTPRSSRRRSTRRRICPRARGRRSARARLRPLTDRTSRSRLPTPRRSARSTSCRSGPTPTRATWTSISCR